jgi:hypothetical protein
MMLDRAAAIASDAPGNCGLAENCQLAGTSEVARNNDLAKAATWPMQLLASTNFGV